MLKKRIPLKYYILEEIPEITIKYFKKKYKQNPFQRIFVQNLLDKEKIFSDEGDIIYIEKEKYKLKINKYATSEISLNKIIDIYSILKKHPKFYINMYYYDLHIGKAKKSLEKQIQLSLSVIRDYLFDTNLILTPNIKAKLNLGRNKINYSEPTILESYNSIILDPYAEDVLTENDIHRTDIFALGGIVDVGLKWEYATERLYKSVDVPRKKIILEDSIIGVPDRINILIKILLEVLYDNKNLKEAIVNNMGLKDIQTRFWHEAKQNFIKENNRVYIAESFLNEFSKKYHVKIDFLKELLKKQKIDIIY